VGRACRVTDYDRDLVGRHQFEKVAHHEAAELTGGCGDDDYVLGSFRELGLANAPAISGPQTNFSVCPKAY
jgi:hypothetical protein